MQKEGWESVIGLEVHCQLSTESKMFSPAASTFGQEPNSNACSIDLGFPGMLPRANNKAIDYAILLGLAIEGEINQNIIFARKHYYYPDLPKGYQISQSDQPIIRDGYIDIEPEDKTDRRIRVERAHLEEDAGKLLHDHREEYSLVDFNRAGVPLIEIVSAPDLRSADEAVDYLKRLRNLVRYLKICDGNMQEGSFRCDANISVRPIGSEKLGVRVEVKNINSFRFVRKAINYEINRQIEILEAGEDFHQETRLYDEKRDITRTMRSKETVKDYRYIPDPDQPIYHITKDRIERVRNEFPEFPKERQKRLIAEYKLSTDQSTYLTSDSHLADFFEKTCQAMGENCDSLLVLNWLRGDLSALLNKDNCEINQAPVESHDLARLLSLIKDGSISSKSGKIVLEKMWSQSGKPDQIISEKKLLQISSPEIIRNFVQEILTEQTEVVKEYQNGKDKSLGFLIGKILAKSKGKANPQLVKKILLDEIGNVKL